MRRVIRSFSPFIMVPIMAPAVSSRPSAAVTTGVVPCTCLEYSTRSLVAAAKARMVPFSAVALTI